jgi:hypothetical protein
VFAIPVVAQEEAACTVADVQNVFNVMADQIAQTASEITTVEEGLDILLGIETIIDLLRTQCGGVTYISENYTNGIIGPVNFAGTLYQVSLSSTGGDSSFATTVLEGDCALFPPSIFTANGGTEETDLWQPGGDCVALFEVNTYGATNWVLTFERLQ